MSDYDEERRVQDYRIDELNRRCATKEEVMAAMAVKLAKAEEKVEDLEEYKKSSETQIKELQAWKNKAAGYIGTFALIAGLAIEFFRDKLFGGS